MIILYVDDDSEDIEIFQEVVKTVDSSVQYISATYGEEALLILNTCHMLPDFLVLDISMPGMDGKAVLHEIRKREEYNAIDVIAYSTNTFPKDVKEIGSLGARFIRKANFFEELCHMVRCLVRRA